MRLRHIAFVVSDLEASADLYEAALGMSRVSQRTPGNFPGLALDMSDGEINFSLLQLTEGEPAPWRGDALGPIHVGVVVDDLQHATSVLEARGIDVYAKKGEPVNFIKFRDGDGIEFDVAASDTPFPRGHVHSDSVTA